MHVKTEQCATGLCHSYFFRIVEIGRKVPFRDEKLGWSILGNQEAPKSLVIVPWKSSEVGRSSSIPPMLDESRQPLDKQVFMWALRYDEIRSEKKL